MFRRAVRAGRRAGADRPGAAAVNLADRAADRCGSLSKGLRQRVALARALLNDPAVLFLDEPTSGLDPVASREVHELITSLREKGVTIFLTTHRLEEAERLCDRVAILNTTLRMIGRPDELRERLFSRSLQVRLRAPLPDPAARTRRPSRSPGLAAGPIGLHTHRDRPRGRRAAGGSGARGGPGRHCVDRRVPALP